MAASPICVVRDGAGSFVPTANGVDVTPGALVRIKLASTDDVDVWALSCVSSDELSDAAAINESLVVDHVLKEASFVMPESSGRTLIFQSLVNGGVGNGRAQSSLRATFALYTRTAEGRRCLAANETNEGDIKSGWVASVNPLIRNPATVLATAFGVSVGPFLSGALFTTDGVNDEQTINNAIAAAVANGSKYVRLLAGTYYLSAPIHLASGVTLQGEGAGVTKLVVQDDSGPLGAAGAFASTNYYAVGCLGHETSGTPTTAGVAVPLTADALQGGSTLTFANGNIEAALVKVGDIIFVQSDAPWEATNLSGRKVGEYAEVLAVTSSTITVSSYMRDDYKVSDNARFFRISFVEDIKVCDLEMSQAAPLDTRTGNPPALIGLVRARRATIQNCYLHKHDGPAITVFQSLDVECRGNVVTDLASNPAQSRYGYGVLVGGASERVVVAGNTFGRCRHAVDAGPSKSPSAVGTYDRGIPRGIVVSNNVASKTASATFSTHSEADGWLFVGNSASHSNDAGFYMRGRGCRIVGNAVEWCGQGIVIGAATIDDQGGSAAGSHVIGNSVRNCRPLASSGALGIGITVSLTDRCVIKGNVISECWRAGIQVRGGTTHSYIGQNTFIDCNLSATVGSLSDAISIDANKSATNASIIAAGDGTMTLQRAGAGFALMHVGRKITVTGAANGANNSPAVNTFVVTELVDANTIKVANPAAVFPDANSGAISFAIENSTDNIIEGNYARNNLVPSLFTRGAAGGVGKMECVVRDYGGAGGNERNVYRGNVGENMVNATSLVRTNGATFLQVGTQDGLGGRYSGSEKQLVIERYPTPLVTADATVTIFWSFVTSANKTYVLRGWVTATNGAGERMYYEVNALVSNVAGVLTQHMPAPITTHHEVTSTADVAVQLSGITLRLRVTGIAGVTLRWRGYLTLDEGSA